MSHEVKHTVTEVVVYTDHEKRTESAEFGRNKRQLVKKLDLPCWVCGSRGPREVHHIHEWALWPSLDPERVLDTLHAFDPYGYTHTMGDKPIESPDDIRNLLVLCGECDHEGEKVAGGHHRGVALGVHDLTFPIWIALRAVKQGVAITKAIKHVQKQDEKLKPVSVTKT